ncbi:MAG TPA: hypothetical protein VMH87_04980 [Pseudomonadales bacterium]|nr:hypothetical protein [Pseudomonadales bacterium]
MTDTSVENAELVRQRIMSRTGEERFIMGARMFEAALEELKRQIFNGSMGDRFRFND